MTELPFGFVPIEEIPGGWCSRVYADETRVLKVPFQGEELDSGYRATWALADRGGPKVFGGDAATGAILMERVRPGTRLSQSTLTEDARLDVFVAAVRSLEGIPIEGAMPTTDYFTRRHPVLDRLVATSPAPVFLHGDLHHENILEGPNGWVIIDPKGVAGDPALEAAAWIRNPFAAFEDEAWITRLTLRRVERLEKEFGWDPIRMMAWCWVDLVIESSGRTPDHPWSRLERALASLLRPSLGASIDAVHP